MIFILREETMQRQVGRPRPQITVGSILWGPTTLHFPCTSITCTSITGVVAVLLHNSGIVLIHMFLIPTIEDHVKPRFKGGKYRSRDWPQGSYDDLGVDLVYNLHFLAHVVQIASCRRVVDSSVRRIPHATKTLRRSRSSACAGRPRRTTSRTHRRLLSSSSTDQVNCPPSLALSQQATSSVSLL